MSEEFGIVIVVSDRANSVTPPKPPVTLVFSGWELRRRVPAFPFCTYHGGTYVVPYSLTVFLVRINVTPCPYPSTATAADPLPPGSMFTREAKKRAIKETSTALSARAGV